MPSIVADIIVGLIATICGSLAGLAVAYLLTKPARDVYIRELEAELEKGNRDA